MNTFRLKTYLSMLVFVFIGFGCQETDVSSVEHRLFNGSYTVGNWRRTDTLIFQKGKFNRLRAWNHLTWKVEEDSIFVSDSRGMRSYFGNSNALYSFRQDTLDLSFRKSDHTPFGRRRHVMKYLSDSSYIEKEQRDTCIHEQYILLESTDSLIRVIRILDSLERKAWKDDEIRSDIQLR